MTASFVRTRSVFVLGLALVASVAGAAPIPPQPIEQAAARADQPEAAPIFKLARVRFQSRQELDTILEVAPLMLSCHPGVDSVDVRVTAEQETNLRARGFEVTIRVADLGALVAAERAQIDAVHAAEANAPAGARGVTYFDTFRTYDEINTRLALWATTRPDLVTQVVVGNSLEGRAIRGIRITGPDTLEHPRAARPQILFEATQHAREWIAPTTAMYIADRLINGFGSDPCATPILESAEVIIVPVVNVDGYVYTFASQNNRYWRKNRRNNGDGTFGVDTNRNWGYEWGGEGASAATNNETYRGSGPFSEPETQVMRDFIIANPRIRAAIDFHSYARLILSPWGYTSALPPEPANSVFNLLNADMQSTMFDVHGVLYGAGPAYTTIYPASGVAPDWFYGGRDFLGWTIELRGTDFVIPADQIIPTGEENFAAVCAMMPYVALPLRFTFPDGLPATVQQGQAAAFRVRIDHAANTVAPGSPTLFVRQGNVGAFTPVAITPLGGNDYQATLPASPCGNELQFSLSAQNNLGQTALYPFDAPGSVLSASVIDSPILFDDACESAAGWTVGAPGDNAQTGVWENAVPQATVAQPGQDASPVGTRCWITGAMAGSGAGSFDVDSGVTTLTSPTFSAIAPGGATPTAVIVSYARWYSNNQGGTPNADSMPIQISNNNGSTWTLLEDVSTNANAWVRVSFDLLANDGIIAPTAQMKLRFIARDLGAASLVEAGIDDVRITVRQACIPACPGDFNGDHTVSPQDIFDFLAAFFTPGSLAADFNHNGAVTPQDIFDFLAAFFTPCP